MPTTWLIVLASVVGPAVGAFFVWLVLRQKAQSYETKRFDMEADIFALQQSLQSKDQRARELESQLETVQSELERVRSEADSKSSRESVDRGKQLRIAEIESALEAKADLFTQLEQENVALKQEVETLKQDVGEKQKRIQDLGLQLKKARTDTKQLKEDNDGLSATVETKVERIRELEVLLEEKAETLKQLQQDFLDTQTDRQATDELIRKTLNSGPKVHNKTVEAHEKLIKDIQDRLDRFEKRFSQPEFNEIVRVLNPEKLSQNFQDLKENDLQPVFSGFKQGFRNLFGGWLGDIKKQYVEQSKQRLEKVKKFKSRGPYTLLVVNDDRKSREQLSTILETEGHIVHGADHREQALTLAEEHRPHLIFIDTMSDMSGFALCRELTDTSALSNIPIIVTAYATEKIVEKSVESGAVDVVTKPFRRLVVTEKLLHHLAHR